MVFADPGAVYIRIGSFLLLMTLGYSDVGLTTVHHLHIISDSISRCIAGSRIF